MSPARSDAALKEQVHISDCSKEVPHLYVKFIYSEKARKFCKISTVDLTGTTQDQSTVEISQNFVAFSEYMNFTSIQLQIDLIVHFLFSYKSQNSLIAPSIYYCNKISNLSFKLEISFCSEVRVSLNGGLIQSHWLVVEPCFSGWRFHLPN